jgi:DNA-binding beta-propeller fold protein YncE/tRNA A-37 threonylcarbamoyl transferase component Bud32
MRQSSRGNTVTSVGDPYLDPFVLGYRVEVLVARGGMGVVYRAYDPRLKRRVAVKLLTPELAADARFRERFLSETELAASLEHPNVVPIHDAGEADGQLYLVMRYVPGTDLKRLLRELGPLAPERALALCGQIADALDAAHGTGLVHRDVKPSNVLVDERGHPYLADFGLTRRLAKQAPDFEAGRSLGTPAYVAPEQIEGKQPDGRADQYSLACLLYECLAGTPPFPRAGDAATLFAHLEEPPPTLPRLERVLPRALAKDPSDRYPTCSAFIADARRALGIAEPVRPFWSRAPVVVGLAVAAALALGALFVVRSGGARPEQAAMPTGDGRVVHVDPASGETLSTTSFGRDLSGVAIGPDKVWVASLGTGEMASIDPDTGEIEQTISVAGARRGPSAIAASGDLVWVVNGADDTVRLYRAGTAQFSTVEPDISVTAGCACPDAELAAKADRRGFWAVSRADDTLQRFTPENHDAQSTSLPAGSDLVALTLDASAVWVVATVASPALFKIDPTTSRMIGSMALPPTTIPTAVASGAGALWVASFADDTVLRIEGRLHSNSSLSQWERLEVVDRIPVGKGPNDVAFGSGSVWTANALDGTVSRIDPETNAVDTFRVGSWPERIAVGKGGVWVTLDPPPRRAATT